MKKNIIAIVIAIIGLVTLGVSGFIFQLYNSKTKEIKEEIKVNSPILTQGMKAIRWDDNFNEIETTGNDPNWYDYSNKKWANAKTEDGSYWVWIPRYAYKITKGYHSNKAGKIEIKFLDGKTNITKDGTTIETNEYKTGEKDTSANYFLHPAFTFGEEELTGIWVAKYEASVADQKDLCYINASEDNCNKSTLIPSFKPNAESWRNISYSNAFKIAFDLKNNNIYGWNEINIETHLMKNSEWGAVAYLAHSKYGANEEIWINNSSNFITGCGGNSVSEGIFEGCQNAYNTATGVKASTTHNITGIYDMSGGSWEIVSAYIDNRSEDLNKYGENILNAPEKYKNIYFSKKMNSNEIVTNFEDIIFDSESYELSKNIYGDAIYETSSSGEKETSWNNDFSLIPFYYGPWLRRGGNFAEGVNSGVFSFRFNGGISYKYNSFRTVLIFRQ